jgi:phosphoglucosamine mutase
VSERKLFGTDGVRGKANIHPMTGEVAMKLGRAVTYYFQQKSSAKKDEPLIILGKDTRLSCYMLEQAFSAGVCSQGGRVILTGPLPTPGVAFVTQSMRADAGVVISASHNPYTDNGIKLFDANGYKLPDLVELELEKMIESPDMIPTPTNDSLGRAKRLDEVFGRYIVHTKSAFSQKYDLEEMRIVLDCANGAGYRVGPMIFEELGAEVITLGVSPNGRNINLDCGSLYPGQCQEMVLQYRADLGICLDGDADRVIISDSSGKVVDGDQLIGLCARFLLDQGLISKGDEVVGTVMTNFGLERYLEEIGLKLHRTNVGDRYIIERMRQHGSVLGGEPSGHIIFKQHSTTGDGILAALKIMESMHYYGKDVRSLVDEIKLYPNILINVQVQRKPPLAECAALQQALREASEILGSGGRHLLRYSGTENLLRVMVESDDPEIARQVSERLVEVVQEELK